MDKRHKMVTSDAEIRAAIKTSALLKELTVKEVQYRSGSGLDLIILNLSDGSRRVIPRENIEGLLDATKKQIANIQILGKGTGLHWPDLDFDLSVQDLLDGVFGNRRWMARLGSLGGSVRSKAKTSAARTNGLKGGRPKRMAVT